MRDKVTIRISDELSRTKVGKKILPTTKIAAEIARNPVCHHSARIAHCGGGDERFTAVTETAAGDERFLVLRRQRRTRGGRRTVPCCCDDGDEPPAGEGRFSAHCGGDGPRAGVPVVGATAPGRRMSSVYCGPKTAEDALGGPPRAEASARAAPRAAMAVKNLKCNICQHTMQKTACAMPKC